MKIAVIYSKPTRRMCTTAYGETDQDSLDIALKVKEGLVFLGFEPTIYEISEDNIEAILDIKTDLVFNLIEWCGHDIHLAKTAFECLNNLGKPYTGSKYELYELTGDKIKLKHKLESLQLPAPFGLSFVTGDENIPMDLSYPMIVKPSLEHCSTGLGVDSIAHDQIKLRKIIKSQLFKFKQPILAEEFIVGRELLMYMIEVNGKVKVLPIEEVKFGSKSKLAFQTYDAKWNTKSDEYKSTTVELAVLDHEIEDKLKKMAVLAFEQLGFWGYARFDVRLRGDTGYLLETNANPSVYDSDEDIKPDQEVIWGIKFYDYLQNIVLAAKNHF